MVFFYSVCDKTVIFGCFISVYLLAIYKFKYDLCSSKSLYAVNMVSSHSDATVL